MHCERCNMISIANQRATKWLEEANLRPTRQRLCLAEVLVGDGQDKHVTAETLFAKVKQTGYTVSLATVYNTLKTFVTRFNSRNNCRWIKILF